jgi:plastocyanin
MATHEVKIEDMSFDPTPIEIKQGDSVVWKNEDSMAHTATADDKKWDTGKIPPGQSSKPITFAASGASPYHCEIHRMMKGVVKTT